MPSKKKGGGPSGGLTCGGCKKHGKLGTMQRCGRCRRVHYCDAACQRKHWKVHAPLCKSVPPAVPAETTPDEPDLECPLCLGPAVLPDGVLEITMAMCCATLFCPSCEKALHFKVGPCPKCRGEMFPTDSEWSILVQRHLKREGLHPMVRACIEYEAAKMFAIGDGVPVDLARSIKCFDAAIAGGLEHCRVDRARVLTSLDTADGIEAWRVLAAEGNAIASTKLLVYYNMMADGQIDDGPFLNHFGMALLETQTYGFKRDSSKAHALLRRAADKGHARAAMTAGLMSRALGAADANRLLRQAVELGLEAATPFITTE
jgi:hypothetical protein